MHPTPTTDGQAAGGPAGSTAGDPTRGGTRDGPPELPELDAGLTLLDVEDRTREALHAMVVDGVLRDGAHALWADARGHASTRPLVTLAPDRRVLERVHVARGFTPFQHYAIVETLAERVAAAADGTAAGDAATAAADADTAATGTAPTTRGGPEDGVPGLLVAPAVDAIYRQDEVRRAEGREMLARSLARLAGVARRFDVPVLLTRSAGDAFAAPVARAASATVTCRWTDLGPRFEGSGFETLVYPVGPDQLQTTLSFWERVLSARAAGAGTGGALPAPERPATAEIGEVSAGGAH